MSEVPLNDGLDVYVWEGSSDIALRTERALAGYDATVIHADASATSLPHDRDAARLAVAVVSVTIMGDGRFSSDWLATQGIPVVWVAGEERSHDRRFYPPEYSYTLPLAFSGAELRRLLFRVAGIAQRAAAPDGPRPPPPLVAESAAMQNLLAEATMFADCRSNALIHGETGVGKERVARLLHDAAAWAAGPFVAVNCGAIPEGLFEAHFFGHAKGAFTGAVGAHKGYFEQAHGGTLFLDEIGDLPLYQQVKLLRVLEQSTVTRLGSTTEVPVAFRLVAATNKDLRSLVAQGEFRPDLYYRLAVIELHIPNLEARGPAEKRALLQAMLRQQGIHEDVPQWVLQRVESLQFPGNVRELSNLAERVAIVRRQLQDWDAGRLTRIFDGYGGGVKAPPAVVPAAALSGAERAERERILAALDSNGWRRQDTAHHLGISRKVLWEKMRKLRLGEPQGETIDGLGEA
ncbi:sigma 54-interacting transcriptional regulator [Bordetella genomosp. 12]|uniref:Sigma-54-dependent Fis family transcriptional regulator n=1 Tax=Bordetella genomosp. 12 TaxID=463035 RepID=A0A261VV11_9BORD|nr:sigma-54 dependent transcriptional regulator [Bordetella genomosp. 12]OZI77938.1 sigma-54-dependent Fis family transcriptional regulator [Bordetella genomosp. 12]